jgi:hypothetical protein
VYVLIDKSPVIIKPLHSVSIGDPLYVGHALFFIFDCHLYMINKKVILTNYRLRTVFFRGLYDFVSTELTKTLK